jgi:hypothetical protein
MCSPFVERCVVDIILCSVESLPNHYLDLQGELYMFFVLPPYYYYYYYYYYYIDFFDIVFMSVSPYL